MTATTDFHHQAYFYADTDELLAGAVPFIREGLEHAEAVMVALPSPSLRATRAELRADEDAVRWVEMEELGRNPARILPAWREFATRNLESGAGARGVGEPIWAGRSEAELDECDRHESLLNLAFAGRATWSLMCPYNTSELPSEVLERAELNHPHLAGTGEVRRSADYLDPRDRRDLLAGALSDPPADAFRHPFGAPDLRKVRHLVERYARSAELADERVPDLVLAASEVAANAIEHGSPGELGLWTTTRGVVCEIASAGELTDPLVGRVRPDVLSVRGRGLWIVNQLCDFVQVRSGERTVVRMLVARGGARPARGPSHAAAGTA